ncbi:hypothetical protein [Shewanella algae]|uniref:hypothetical protein n=1 Tax=Shewanella algae TaxID=38313 RepID=UPI001AB00D11|nr:hypothetical protein [Shewanella algae]MBO2582805.1 hypothetical protein [Shewanella algae]
MNENLKRLITLEEFTDDEPVELAAVDKDLLPGPIESKYWVCISERLWSRLLSYGTAYELHFQQVIEPIIDTVIGSEQCESFVEELEFLMGVTKDHAFLEALSVVRREAGKVINRRNMRLVISPP